jgi:hypothetical protein
MFVVVLVVLIGVHLVLLLVPSLQLKQRLLSFSPHIQTASGEREIDLERFLYLSCRSFRSAQRRFKRALKKNLKLDNNQYGEKRKHVTESEFVESVLHVEPRWLPHQARAIFQQGQQQLAEQHAQEGRSTNNNIVVALEDRLRLLLLLLLLLVVTSFFVSSLTHLLLPGCVFLLFVAAANHRFCKHGGGGSVENHHSCALGGTNVEPLDAAAPRPSGWGGGPAAVLGAQTSILAWCRGIPLAFF